jgi:hypothetical protein
MDVHFSNGLNLTKTESLYVTRRQHRSRLDTINLNLHSEKGHQRLLLCQISANMPDSHDQRSFSRAQTYSRSFRVCCSACSQPVLVAELQDCARQWERRVRF